MTQPAKDQDARPGQRGHLAGRVCLPPPKAHLIFWSVLAAGILLDLWTKSTVFNWLDGRPGGTFAVINGFVQLIAVQNAGAAFGIAAGQTAKLIVFSFLALAVILALFFFGAAQSLISHLALAFFAAGICGNLYDRIFNNGLVRDFIDVVYWPGKHWPTFNLADTMLCVAVALILLSPLLTPGRQQQ